MGAVGRLDPGLRSKMKIFAVLLLATAILGMEMEHEKMFKTWTKMKAHEACWGEENTKKYTVQLKRAVAKCTHQDAPELELPIYRSPYRVVNALLNNANQHERYVVNLLENIVDNLNNNQRHNNNQQYNERRHDQNYNNHYNQQYNNNNQYRPMTYRQAMTYRPQQYTQEYEEKTINRLASDVLRKVYEQEQQYKNYQDNYNMFDRRDNYKSNDYKNNDYMNNDHTPMRFNVEQSRYKRQSVPPQAGDNNVVLPNVLDLGDRLRDKILDAEKRTQEMIGNVTCVMKELNVINDNHQIDIAAIKNNLNQYQLTDWFKKRIENDYDNCYAVSQNVPASAQNAFVYPGNPHLTKLKAFMSCCKMAKLQSCVYQDVKVKLEKNFGPLQKLLDTTGLTEQQIFPLVMQLLHGNEMEYFEM